MQTVGAFLKGGYNTGTVSGAWEAFAKNWNERVEDENSFHPVLDTLLGSLWIASSWLYLDKLQMAVMGYQLNFIMKYSTMNMYFALKGEVHKEHFVSENVTRAMLKGAIRGAIKNPLASASIYVQDAFKLSQAMSLLHYQAPGRDAYLEFWMGSVPQTLLKSSEQLITVLWLARDVWDVVITTLSDFYADLLRFVVADHASLRKNVYEYRGTIMATIIAGIIAYYDGERLGQYLSETA